MEVRPTCKYISPLASLSKFYNDVNDNGRNEAKTGKKVRGSKNPKKHISRPDMRMQTGKGDEMEWDSGWLLRRTLFPGVSIPTAPRRLRTQTKGKYTHNRVAKPEPESQNDSQNFPRFSSPRGGQIDSPTRSREIQNCANYAQRPVSFDRIWPDLSKRTLIFWLCRSGNYCFENA